MSLDIDLSRSPYGDDFAANNNFYRVLFRPEIPVQARELTQGQTILQDQIEKFGRYTFKEGSPVTDLTKTYEPTVHYVKITDSLTLANGSVVAVTTSDFVGKTVEASNGLKAIVAGAAAGFLATSPDLNTIYIDYLGSASDYTTNKFDPDQTLTVKTELGATIGTIKTANNAVSGSSSYLGVGYKMSIAGKDAVVFSKGFFISVANQSVMVTKYDNYPDGVSVGFETTEEIVTPEEDSSLLDNAAGYPNYAAPGAHRLRLIPNLVVRNTNETSNTTPFLSLTDFVEGHPSISPTDPVLNLLGDAQAQTLYNTEGDFVVSPWNVRLITRYTDFPTNSTIDTANLRLEIDPGLGYVKGYKVQTVGQLPGHIGGADAVRKGNDVRTLAAQVATATMGSYLYCNQVAGHWDFTSSANVSLRSATATAISSASAIGNDVSGLSAPGSELGTAELIGFEYDSGTPGDTAAEYRIYLFNVQMATGKNFADVRSLYTISGGVKGFADVALTSGSCVLQDQKLSTLIYPMATGAMKTLLTETPPTTMLDYRKASTLTVATNGIGTLSFTTAGPGGSASDEFPYGLGQLSTVNEREFVIVSDNTRQTANLVARVDATVAEYNLAFHAGQSNNFSSLFIPGDRVSVGNSAPGETRLVVYANSSFLNVSSAWSSSYSNAAIYKTYTAGQSIPTSLDSTQTITIDSTTSATINLAHTFTATVPITVYHDVRRTQAKPAKKLLYTSVFVKIDCSSNAGGVAGPWCLGVPDLYRVKHVYVGASYADTNQDLIDQFTWDTGQRDAFYGLSSLVSAGFVGTTSTKILVEAECFVPDVSQGIGFYTVDSYPIDDTGVTANTILTQNIPFYTSIQEATNYNLRNCIDLRLHTANTAALINVISSATINPANTTTFAGVPSNLFVPAPDSSFESDIEYYLGRRDIVGLTPKGTVIHIEGTPSENPAPPVDISAGITLATVNVPPYPTLGVDQQGNNYPTVTLQYKKNRRYTMRDIGALDDRLSRVEYWTALNVLEQSAKDLLIPNASGVNRFQNGILADPFVDNSIGNVLDTQYNIAIDKAVSEIRPVFTQTPIQLKYNSGASTNTQVSSNGRLILLKNEKVAAPYLFQQFATQVRNPSQDVAYRWAGHLDLTPDGDYQPDVTVNPATIVPMDLKIEGLGAVGSVWQTFWGDWQETSRSSSDSSAVVNEGGWWGDWSKAGNVVYGLTPTVETTTTTAINQIRSGVQEIVGEKTNLYNLGSYVTDVSLQPYIRPQMVFFAAHGLKPNTQHWPFMDDVPISNYCSKAAEDKTLILTPTLVSNGLGSIYGWYAIPSTVFHAGERVFKLCDVDNLVTKSTDILSNASATFYGTNLAYAKNNIELQTTTSTLYAKAVQQTQTIYTSTSSTSGGSLVSDVVNCDCYTSPCAQSFRLPQEILYGEDIPVIYVTAIDLFFEKKDPTLGIQIMVREMENGYPTTRIVPFGSVHLKSADVNVSEDATLATTVTFPAPLMLETGKEYCVVARADGFNPNYALWTAALGGSPDVTTGSPLFHNSFAGNFFTSSNDTGWTAYQQEDMKMSVYRLTFTELTGTAVLNNDDSEYLKVVDTLGEFKIGETVYFSNNEIQTGGVTAATGNNIVFVTSTTGISNQDAVYLFSNTNAQAFVALVANTPANTTALLLNTAPTFTDADCSIGRLRNQSLLNGVLLANAQTEGFSNVAAATVAYGGTGYAPGDVVTVVGGDGTAATLNVLTESGNVALTLSVNTAGNYSQIYPANLSTTYVTGTGTGLRVDVSLNRPDTALMTVGNSTATGTWHATSGTRVIGSQSNATAVIVQVADVPYNTVMPKLAISTPNDTGIQWWMKGTANSALSYSGDSANVAFTFAQQLELRDHERVVMSRSNELVSLGGAKSLTVYADMVSESEKLSPAIDTIKVGMLGIHNRINAEDSAGRVVLSEKFNDGFAIDRYISRAVVLADGQDAEDLKVLIAAYKPGGTDILVFARLMNGVDGDSFRSKAWTQMTTSTTIVGSRDNPNDFNEYEYHLPTGTSDPGDTTAWLNDGNSGIVRYTSATGQIYDTYKTLAVKIVFLANDSAVVPRAQDMRAIALAASG